MNTGLPPLHQKNFEPWMEDEAKKMAEEINGGKWETHYSETQKQGWRLKILWAINRFSKENK